MKNHKTQPEILHLFDTAGCSYFQQHGAGLLLTHRNPHVGSLLVSERSVFYLNILYRLLLFKRDYELEPLYEDIFNGVLSAQQGLSQAYDQTYDRDQFRSDLNRLEQWDLVDFRIEKQRLRGYRDNRKRKFRYRLKNEALHLLEWLEQRCLDDIQHRGNDTRDLLGETRGSLGELLRLLHSFKTDADGREEIARRILFQLFKAGDLGQEISTGLADLNGRLLFFLVQNYQIDQVRALIVEIDAYVDTFLKQTYSLRQEILPLLDRLQQDKNRSKLLSCHEIMEAERLRTPNLLQTRRNINVAAIPERLQLFFEEQGGLDQLLQRINNSAMHVWQKLRSHLRELERKNNRIQDIRRRMEELAGLADDQCATDFINTLLAQSQNRFDPNYWDEVEKAEPPAPKKRTAARATFPKQYLRKKKTTGKAVESMDEARLKALRQWIADTIPFDDTGTGALSRSEFHSFDDFPKVIELARAGLLADGKRLSRIDYQLTTGQRQIMQAVDDFSLCCPEMALHSTTSGKS